jgi:hypothetical protein
LRIGNVEKVREIGSMMIINGRTGSWYWLS